MKKKTYSSAPLPFMGQKRRFVKEFRKVLAEYPDDVTIVDLFGGSGILSHTAKAVKPNATIVYNDFDNFRKRLEHIPHTNALLDKIRPLACCVDKLHRISNDMRDRIRELVREEEKEVGFVDFYTISQSLMFSMKYATNLGEFLKATLYNRMVGNEYNADGYLDGLTIVSEDYKVLFERYKDMPNVLFVLDPPYLSTDVGAYTEYWSLSKYLDVLQLLMSRDFVYFTSNKSQLLELCKWLGKSGLGRNLFDGARRIELPARVNHSSEYIDIMMYKRTSADKAAKTA
jgi:hypothetical protein|nr:MAG TPA: DNA adenine methylase [Caudoviricetes sp.]